jgi:crotonobetainyl-CoA:carnitine CoA-transferase CaiB-like acyl-CoA transferase
MNATGDSEKWVSIAIGGEAEWRALCQAMGRAELADDPRFKTAELRKRNEAVLDQIITNWTKERDRWETTGVLQNAGIAAFPSMSSKDLAEDPHLRARGWSNSSILKWAGGSMLVFRGRCPKPLATSKLQHRYSAPILTRC